MNKIKYSNAFFLIILCILMAGKSFSITSYNQVSKQLIVVIDPGHGGKDPGAVNKTIREKDVVLGIGLKLGKLINENYPDVKVVFTRNTDVFVPLIERSRIANKSKADLFISLHANFCATPSTKGTETFTLGLHRSNDNLEIAKKENSVILLEKDYNTTYEGFDPNLSESYIMFELMQSSYLKQSVSFADEIQQQFKSRLQSTDRSVKQAGFLVLRQSSMPSVLIETGFLSNPTEANYLNSEDGQRNIALSIAEAFRKFKTKNSGLEVRRAPEVSVSQQKHEDTLTKQEVHAEKQKAEEIRKEEIELPTINSEKNKKETSDTASLNDLPKIADTLTDSYFSVQIGASTTMLEPVGSNFKGLKNIRREKTDKYYRYYIGQESTLEQVNSILKQIKLKFPEAFIVSFVDGKKVPFNFKSK